MGADLKLTERKRIDIMAAATREFSSNGFTATSMDRVAEAAGVSKRTVYNHFDSKETLFKAVSQALFNDIIRVSDHPYDAESPVEVQLRAIAEQEMALLSTPAFIRSVRMFSAETLASPELSREMFDNFQESSIGVVKWIRQAQRDGKLAVADPVMAGKQFLALIKAFAFWPQLYDYKPVLDAGEQRRVIDAAIKLFMNTYQVDAG